VFGSVIWVALDMLDNRERFGTQGAAATSALAWQLGREMLCVGFCRRVVAVADIHPIKIIEQCRT
jgi:hypothetical protein